MNIDTPSVYSCAMKVIRSLRSDKDFATFLRRLCESKLSDFNITLPEEDLSLLNGFIDVLEKNEDESLMKRLKELLGFNETQNVNRFEKSLKSVCEKFFEAIESRCQDREMFKSFFNKPDLFERGIGMIIFSILFLYGWINEETSMAFAESMQNAQKTNSEMSLLDVALANYLQMGSIQILWSMGVTITKSWFLLAAMVCGLYFVETFAVEAFLNLNSKSKKVMGMREICGQYFGETVAVEGFLNLKRENKNPMKSIRVATFFILDRRVVYAVVLAFLVSIVFASCCSMYLAMTKGTLEEAKFVGKMVIAFQLLLVFSFVLYVVLRSEI